MLGWQSDAGHRQGMTLWIVVFKKEYTYLRTYTVKIWAGKFQV
jgi:hypothetical protein